MKSHFLFARDFTLMVVGQIVSLFGNSILRFALSLHVLETTGSAAAFGGISALAMVPTLLCGPLGGVLADRVPRQAVMWGLDFATAGLTLGYALLFPGGGPLGAAGAMMVLLAAIQALYQPAVQASVPLLAPEGRLAAANGAVSQVQALANLLGPVLGGVLCTWAGLGPLLGVGSACFFASAVMELFLRIPFVRRAGGGFPFATAVRDLGEAGRFLLGERPALAGLAGLAALVNLTLSALLVVGLPYLVNVALALTPSTTALPRPPSAWAPSWGACWRGRCWPGGGWSAGCWRRGPSPCSPWPPCWPWGCLCRWPTARPWGRWGWPPPVPCSSPWPP